MMYDIQTQYDVSAGALLTVRFPETDLDKKALYTLQTDQPEFLVPFRYRSMDGFAECVYQLDSRSKLQYRFGNRSPKEYVEFWTQILQPLLDCDDWFLKPLSFVLDTEHLYIDKAGKTVSYLYVPSISNCVEYDALKSMVMELSQKNSTTDHQLENQVLRAIMQDFQPKAFLQMLHERTGQEPKSQPHQPAQPPVRKEPVPQDHQLYPHMPAAPAPSPTAAPAGAAGDIQIHIGASEKKAETKKDKRGGLFGPKKPKEPKPPKEKNKKKGLFGGKDSVPPKEVVLGAGSGDAQRISPPAPKPDWVSAPLQPLETEEDGVTELMEEGAVGNAYLRLASDAPLPPNIPVVFQNGQPFTIGRFDVSVGTAQSSFEFDKHTKAVSRHHAAIERLPDGSCQITDLASSGGTFVNGARLTPNVPCFLTRGDRISFGTCGADYIWEG